MAAEKTPSHRVVVVTGTPFWIESRGSSERISAMLDYLSSFCEVTVCYLGELPIQKWNQSRRQLGFELIGPGAPGKVASVIVDQLAPMFPRSGFVSKKPQGGSEPIRLEDFQSAIISDYVKQAVTKRQPHVVLLEYVTLAYLCDALRELEPRPLLMLDSHDLMHQRQRAFEKMGVDNWLQVSAEEETMALEKADVVLAIQELEAQRLTEMLGDRCQVCLAKHAIRHCEDSTPFRADQFAQRTSPIAIGFLGSAGKANQLGLADFIEQVWPAIMVATGSEIVLKIGGGITTEFSLDPTAGSSQIELLGRFDNVADFYQQINLAINPALIPSGLKIKSLECLAHSVPLVTTSAGIAGLERAAGRCVDVADEPKQLIESILRLVQNPSLLQNYSDNCRSFIESEFAPEVIYAEMRKRIERNEELQ